MRVVLVAISVTACTQNAVPEPEVARFPTRIVTPLCADAHPPVALEFRAIRDPQPHKPSKDVRHYLVDLRISRSDQRDDLWLLIDEEVFPSAVDSVHTVEEPVGLRLQHPRESWSFTGGAFVRAWPLGRARESWFRNVSVSTGSRRIPVSLGSIDVGGMPARHWVGQAGAEQRRDSRDRVAAAFESFCTTWFDLEAE